MACLLAQQKLQLDYKTNITQIHQKSAVWKSDNQGFKEVTFIQTGRRDRDMWRGAERHGDVEWVVPHPRVVDKNWEGYLRGKGS